MNTSHDAGPVVFAPATDHVAIEEVARLGGWLVAPHEEREFEDGEHKIRPLLSVRDRDVYVLTSLYSDGRRSVNDKLCRLLFFLGALRDAGSRRLTAVIPYLCYARKDRRTKPHDPVTSKYVALLLESVGTDRVVTIDVHNLAAFENASRIPAEHLEARWLLARHVADRLSGSDVVVVSPDAGGIKRARRFREALERILSRPVEDAFVEKHRSEGVLSGGRLIGNVAGRVAVIVDDLIGSGSTLARAAHACHNGQVRAVHAVATHGMFVGDAPDILGQSRLASVVVTNTIPAFRWPRKPSSTTLEVVSIAPLLAIAIDRLHTGGSLVEMLEHPA